jgi:uncharacterized protein YhhL (DUF1145 family)
MSFVSTLVSFPPMHGFIFPVSLPLMIAYVIIVSRWRGGSYVDFGQAFSADILRDAALAALALDLSILSERFETLFVLRPLASSAIPTAASSGLALPFALLFAHTAVLIFAGRFRDRGHQSNTSYVKFSVMVTNIFWMLAILATNAVSVLYAIGPSS